MPVHRLKSVFAVVVTLSLIPAAALAQSRPMTPGMIFAEAAPLMKMVMAVLLLAMGVAVGVAVRKVSSGKHLAGGSAFVSALRLGAPLLGLLGAAFNGLMMFAALADTGPQPMNVLAPGLAEAMFLLVLGLSTGVVAVICHWAIESRIDRMVLKA